MKVGDLVGLSARGSRLAYCDRFKNKLGIIIEVRATTASNRSWVYPIVVQWFNSGTFSHARDSLKYISKA